MERKIGEIFEYNGEWCQCVEGNGCENCAFKGRKCYLKGGTDDPIGECCYDRRRDNKDVIFKKLEKVGEPVTVKGRTFQKLTSDNTSCKECVFNVPNRACYKNSYIDGPCQDNEFWVEIKQNKEDMEEKNNGNTPLNVLTDKYVNEDICYDDFEKEVKALYSCKEEIKPTLKEFDLEAAKEGKPVCTRDGRKARIICFDRNDLYPIVALIECEDGTEMIGAYSKEGQTEIYEIKGTDLMMLPEKKEGWVNVYKERIYDTKEEAIEATYDGVTYIDTIKISWEE